MLGATTTRIWAQRLVRNVEENLIPIVAWGMEWIAISLS